MKWSLVNVANVLWACSVFCSRPLFENPTVPTWTAWTKSQIFWVIVANIRRPKFPLGSTAVQVTHVICWFVQFNCLNCGVELWKGGFPSVRLHSSASSSLAILSLHSARCTPPLNSSRCTPPLHSSRCISLAAILSLRFFAFFPWPSLLACSCSLKACRLTSRLQVHRRILCRQCPFNSLGELSMSVRSARLLSLSLFRASYSKKNIPKLGI